MFEKAIWRLKTHLINENRIQEGRLGYLDTVKAIGIILVVIGHSTYVNDNLLTWLVSFHMPLFFVVSGFLFANNKGKNINFRSYANKRFRGMMIPYFSFSIIYLLIDIARIVCQLGDASIEGIIDRLLQFLSFYGISVMWFLPAIFAGEMLLFFVSRKMPILLQVLIGAIGIFLPGTIKPVIESLASYHEGYLFTFIMYLLLALLRVLPSLSFLLTGIAIYYLLNVKKWGAKFEILMGCLFLIVQTEVAFLNERVDLHFMVFGKPELFFLGAVSGSLGLILICRHIPAIIPLNYLGKNSLIIMATHVDFYVVALGFGVAQILNLYITVARPYFFALNLFGIILIVEILLIYVINNFFPWIMGKGNLKKLKKKGSLC